MRISVRGASPAALPPIRAAIRVALREGGAVPLPAGTLLTLAFIDDAAMRELNVRYRHIGRTTDVLSFGQRLRSGAKGGAALRAMVRDVDGSLDLGDIVISVDQAARQARRRGRTVASEIAFLAAHGALHLLGYEDETAAGYREMVRLGTNAIAGSPARSRARRVGR